MSNKKFCCTQMEQHVENGLVRYDERYDQYDLIVREEEGTQTLQQIYYCPWSGSELPPTQRDRWFDELEAKGIDPMNDPIPEDYRGANWRRNREHIDKENIDRR